MTLPLVYPGTLQACGVLNSKHCFSYLSTPKYSVHQELDLRPFLPNECPKYQITFAVMLMVPLAKYTARQRWSEFKVDHTTCCFISVSGFILDCSNTLQGRCAQVLAQCIMDISRSIPLGSWDENSSCLLLCGRILTIFL